MSSAARIAGKVVVITGGARGIGYATARTLRDLGAQVAIGDVDEAKVKESGAELGLDVYGALDVTDPDSFEAFLDQVERTLGPIDVLVNNAGIMPTGHFADEPDRVSRRILDINVYGVVLGSKLATRRMLERGRGHVINIASLAGVVATPGLATYCASKAAVLALTDTLRLEYRDRGIEFSAVTPTFTNTELVAGTAGAKGHAQRRAGGDRRGRRGPDHHPAPSRRGDQARRQAGQPPVLRAGKGARLPRRQARHEGGLPQ